MEFKDKANIKHNFRYDYSLVDYINNKTNVKIICKKHGIFEQRPSNHLTGNNCPKCVLEKKNPNDEYILKLNEVHNNKYDYSLFNYVNGKTKVKIICTKVENGKQHGVFKQRIDTHLSGKGCPTCGGNAKSNTEEFIIKAGIKHNNFYDYSLVNYINNKTKVKIICPEHGIFEQTPNAHLAGKKCKKCLDKTNEDIILEGNKIHGNKYDYSLINYINAKTKIKIICPEHGMFEQTPDGHISKKQGCPSCNESKGEREIRIFLNSKNIKYSQQHTFFDCKHIRSLPFDFYLPEMNICIEYNGIQHYEPVKYYGGDKSYEDQKIKDEIKAKFCKDNNIQLIVIKYDENVGINLLTNLHLKTS